MGQRISTILWANLTIWTKSHALPEGCHHDIALVVLHAAPFLTSPAISQPASGEIVEHFSFVVQRPDHRLLTVKSSAVAGNRATALRFHLSFLDVDCVVVFVGISPATYPPPPLGRPPR